MKNDILKHITTPSKDKHIESKDEHVESKDKQLESCGAYGAWWPSRGW